MAATAAAVWMLLLCGIEAIALTVLRIENTHTVLLRGIVAALIYAFAVVPLLLKTLHYEGIGMVNFLWNIVSTILMFLIGVYVFGETIAHLQYIGILVACVGLGLILIGDTRK